MAGKIGLPMNQDASTGIEPVLDKGVAGGEMLDDVVVIHVIDLDDVVVEIEEEMVIERQPQCG